MHAPRRSRERNCRGTLASLGASILFGVIFLVPPHLLPLNPQEILGYRIIAMIAFVSAIFWLFRAWNDLAQLVNRLRSKPLLIPVLIVNASLLGVQLWLFGWAPQTGHGLDVSLGYLILPVVMVLVSVVVYRERQTLLTLLATVAAGVGVLGAVTFAGGLNWPTLLVVLGFPPYFISRRIFALNTTGAQLAELITMLPFSAYTLATTPALATVHAQPELVIGLLVLGLLSATAFALYLTASRLLPFAVFGVLGYVEPILMVLVSLAWLDETWDRADALTYLPICLGLALLVADALRPPRDVQPAPSNHPHTPCCDVA